MDVIEGGGGDEDPPRWTRLPRWARWSQWSPAARSVALVAAAAVVVLVAIAPWRSPARQPSGALPVDTADASPFHPTPPLQAVIPGRPGPLAPLVGGVSALRLANGTFAYVSRVSETRARVIEAVSPRRVGGLGVELLSCPGTGAIVDPVSGATFDRFGRYVAGPARRDLAYRSAFIAPEGAVLSVGPRRRPAYRSRGVRVAGCAAAQLRTAQEMLRMIPAQAIHLRPGRRAQLLAGVLTVSRGGELRLCDGFFGRSDCGRAGYPVAVPTAALATLTGGRYPWVVAREVYARLGTDRRLHDLVVASSPRPQPSPFQNPSPLYVLAKHVSGRTLRADPVLFLSGDAANLAAAADRAEVPAPNDHYLADADRRYDSYLVRPDATFTVVNREHEAFADQVDFARWAHSVNARPGRLWLLKLDAIGRVRLAREQFMP